MSMNCKNCKASCVHKGEDYSGKCLVGYVPMTNADKIRQMDDTELVNVIRCPGNIDEKYYDMNECGFSLCDECKLKWLKEVAKET